MCLHRSEQRFTWKAALPSQFLALLRPRIAPGVEVGDNSTVRLDMANMPQPDCLLFVQPEHGGRSALTKTAISKALPDLVAEGCRQQRRQSGSGEQAHCLSPQRCSGVCRLEGARAPNPCAYMSARENGFELLVPAADGVLRGEVFLGLWLDPTALVRGDVYALLALVQQGLSSHEHVDFAAKLEQARIV